MVYENQGSIKVRNKTFKKLESWKETNESWDDFINSLMNFWENKHKDLDLN